MIETFDDRERASQAAADAIDSALRRRLDAQQAASLVVSGGTTPGRCFEILSRSGLDWNNVTVTLSDERVVPESHADSNARLVRETLLTHEAAAASFLPLVDPLAPDVGAVAELEQSLRTLPFPFACALLGMGEDGHFASLFPDAANLPDGLATDGSALALPIATAASPHPRVSLTLAALSRSDVIILLVFGDDKREVLRRAETDEQVADQLPVRQLLRQKRATVRVLWAP